MTIAIACEAEGYPESGSICHAAIEIDFGPIEADHVQACTRLRIEDLIFEGWRLHYGFDILTFADGLAQMHSQTQGTARLNDWDGETVLCLTVINRPRGQIAIGGQFIPAVFQTEAASEDDLLCPRLLGGYGGIRIAFEGLVTDQSYLPSVIGELRRFLSDSGISVRSPMG